MPRAFCPECGSEVPVDMDGVCHVGHVIDLSTANVRADGSDEVGGTAAPTDPNEPEPWVASVDTTTLGGYTPPPGSDATSPAPAPPADEPAGDLSGLSGAADLPLPPSSPASPPPVMRAEPDEPPYEPTPDAPTFDLSSSDDLAQAAAEAAAYTPEGTAADQDEDVFEFSQTIEDASDGHSLGWSPPTQSPVAGAPIPPPAPVDPPAPATGETLSGEFDLDDLEAAVSELSSDPAPAPTTAPVEPTPPPVQPAVSDEDDDLDVLSAFDEPEPSAPTADLPPPAAPTREIPPLAPPTGSPAPPSGEPAPPAAPPSSPPAETPAAESPTPAHRLPAPDPGPEQDPEDVDLSHFTAKGAGSSGGGGLKGLFRRR